MNTVNDNNKENSLDNVGGFVPMSHGKSIDSGFYHKPAKFIERRDVKFLITFIIILNTIVIFISGYFPNNKTLEYIDAAFTLIFVVEAILKIHSDEGLKVGWKRYWSDGWNRFDFIILVIALPSIAELFFDSALPTNELLALRCFRVLKSLKMLPHMPDFDRLFRGLKSAFKTTFFIFLVIFAVLSSTLFGEIAPDYFGNPGISLYSIFRLFTIEGLYELPDVIASNSSPAFGWFAKFYFSVLLFAGGIIGVSLINSIFVDAMAADNNNDVLAKLDNIEKEIKQLAQQQNSSQDTSKAENIPNAEKGQNNPYY